ncbi:MAG: DegV family protein [Eubacteriales bacterium]|nr:DegV family protein [Eubacteriales bacterium]
MSNLYPYSIVTDTASDLPYQTIDKEAILIADLHYSLQEGAMMTYDMGRTGDAASFYTAMRNGVEVTTIPVLPEAFMQLWEPSLVAGEDVLCITLSRFISKTFAAAQQARFALLTQYLDRRIVIVDAACSAVAQGMLVFEAAEQRKEGRSMDEVAAWLVQNRQHVNALLIPEDVRWLKAGDIYDGGVPLLSRRCLLKMDAEGGFVRLAQVKNDELAIELLCDELVKTGFSLDGQVISVTHADAAEKAAALAEQIRRETGCAGTMMLPMSPVTGAYAGPGAIGVAYFGNARN